MTSPAFNTFGNSTGVQNPFLQTAAAPQKIDPQAAVLATTLLSVLSLAMSKGGTGDKADFTNALKDALGGGPDDAKKAHKNRHGKQAGKAYGMKRKKVR